MKKMIVISMLCALAGVGVAVAQDRGERGRGERGHGGEHECDGHHGHGRGHGMLKKMDTNNDGRITRAEFNAKAEERFKRMDANNDGVVTLEELQQRRGDHDADHRGHGPRGGAADTAGRAGTGG